MVYLFCKVMSMSDIVMKNIRIWVIGLILSCLLYLALIFLSIFAPKQYFNRFQQKPSSSRLN